LRAGLDYASDVVVWHAAYEFVFAVLEVGTLQLAIKAMEEGIVAANKENPDSSFSLDVVNLLI
jgi:hypothetical protein